MQKPHYTLLCGRLCRTVRLLPPPSAKDFLQDRSWKEERKGRGTYSVKLLSSHALTSRTSPPPHRESFEAALLHLWSMDLTVNKKPENGLQTTTLSHCLHFQEETADIQKASSILIKMFIILEEEREKGRERVCLNTKNFYYFSLLLPSPPSHQRMVTYNTTLLIVTVIIKLDASFI